MTRINHNLLMEWILFVPICLLALESCKEKQTGSVAKANLPVVTDTAKQKAILEKIISLLPPDRTTMGGVSFLDVTLKDWIKRTGELPPDFDRMPSIPFLPDPLDSG